MNIYEKLLKISSDLQTVAKNLEISIGGKGYKAVGEADVLRAIKPLEAQYGVYSYPVKRQIIETGTLESADYKGNVKKQLFERIETTYRFVNTEKPEEYIDIISYGDGIDTGDKSVGKAMTYADKYALMKAYKIVTGDDPDQEPSNELHQADTHNVENVIAPETLQKCAELGIDIDKVAVYLKKTTKELTNGDLVNAIVMKQQANARKQ